jgi:nucleoid DNA-binding protein
MSAKSYNELIISIAKKHGITPDKVNKIIRSYINAIKKEVCNGNEVVIRGIGTFSLNRKGKVMLRRDETVKHGAHIRRHYRYNSSKRLIKK